MKAYDKEFYEVIEHFEKAHKKSTSRSSLKRAEKESSPRGWFYEDSETNQMFQMYMAGFSYGQSET